MYGAADGQRLTLYVTREAAGGQPGRSDQAPAGGGGIQVGVHERLRGSMRAGKHAPALPSAASNKQAASPHAPAHAAIERRRWPG
ncbi:hypothetical protein G6F59_013169 [Rhizopus arrhizus]|nr:hypothetical protein G6F59_013169 [Rhizopus arrhizus]